VAYRTARHRAATAASNGINAAQRIVGGLTIAVIALTPINRRPTGAAVGCSPSSRLANEAEVDGVA
jgi:hypothetical protein